MLPNGIAYWLLLFPCGRTVPCYSLVEEQGYVQLGTMGSYGVLWGGMRYYAALWTLEHGLLYYAPRTMCHVLDYVLRTMYHAIGDSWAIQWTIQ